MRVNVRQWLWVAGGAQQAGWVRVGANLGGPGSDLFDELCLRSRQVGRWVLYEGSVEQPPLPLLLLLLL
jgi:hypothetical protein